jgi:hypothetical protein
VAEDELLLRREEMGVWEVQEPPPHEAPQQVERQAGQQQPAPATGSLGQTHRRQVMAALGLPKHKAKVGAEGRFYSQNQGWTRAHASHWAPCSDCMCGRGSTSVAHFARNHHSLCFYPTSKYTHTLTPPHPCQPLHPPPPCRVTLSWSCPIVSSGA